MFKLWSALALGPLMAPRRHRERPLPGRHRASRRIGRRPCPHAGRRALSAGPADARPALRARCRKLAGDPHDPAELSGGYPGLLRHLAGIWQGRYRAAQAPRFLMAGEIIDKAKAWLEARLSSEPSLSPASSPRRMAMTAPSSTRARWARKASLLPLRSHRHRLRQRPGNVGSWPVADARNACLSANCRGSRRQPLAAGGSARKCDKHLRGAAKKSGYAGPECSARIEPGSSLCRLEDAGCPAGL
ncbi:hypothetical protein CYD53_105306 [Bosea psychrotolerans]|uniref:Uncharacterized protein n=1 Tax=Bosea psychrotolerans TaxID=1871628 RepID=A0A2S4MDA5_9HYPH|nr:hypothetical protein CYD53_105306 [Bosea psychrotolerans]